MRFPDYINPKYGVGTEVEQMAESVLYSLITDGETFLSNRNMS
jgi:hypothetical protein